MVRTLIIIAAFLLGACSESDFSGVAGGRKKTDDSKKNGTDAGDSDGGDSDAGDSDGGGKDGGVDGDGDSDGDGGIDSDNDSSNDGGLGGDDDASIEEGEIMTTDEIAKLPGVEVVKVGVNFEDSGLSGDRDHNDAVLCFDGKFKVDAAAGNVTSLTTQTVKGRTFSSAGCDLSVRVEVVGKDGQKEAPITFAANSGQEVTMNFKKGSKLEVFMTSTDGCNEGVEKNMHSNVDCKVEPDVCRDSGG